MIQTRKHAPEDPASGVADASDGHAVRGAHLDLPVLGHPGRLQLLLVSGTVSNSTVVVDVVVAVAVAAVGHES